jgi:predicted PurR-regulated permease PerM
MKNILGWVLIVVGLIMILGDIFVSYNYFTGKDKFPEIFKESVVSNVSNNSKINSSSGGDVQQQIQSQVNETVGNTIRDQVDRALPASSITLMLNASLWSIFAFFLLSAGAKLAKLGGGFVKEKREEE